MLRTSPLVWALGAAPTGDAPGWLRRTLIQAIESLKPGDDVPVDSPAQRTYQVLHYRYVEQLSQGEVAEQLGLGVRQMKREQSKALEVLAYRLREQHGLEVDLSGDTVDGAGKGDIGEGPLTASDLRWLEEAPDSGPVELSTVLPGVLELVQPIAARYRVRLAVAESGPLPSLAVDTVALRQTLLSLLFVAVHRTAGGKLSLSAQRSGQHIAIGIEGTLAHPSAETAPEDAANLATARSLVDACGGSLTLAATGSFSAAILLPAVAQIPVLVIDDNADALQLLQRYAAYTRYRVFPAQDAAQAVALAQEISPQAIVLDIMMPRVDGWDLLGQLRNDPTTKAIPVIACTILAQEEMAISLGVAAFLQKPVSRRAFLAALDRLLGA